LTKRVIVKKNGESFKDLSQKIGGIGEKTGVDITYISVSKFPDKQELWVKGDTSAFKNFMEQLANIGLLPTEELLIPL
jgi:hypothetical protein